MELVLQVTTIAFNKEYKLSQQSKINPVFH